MERAQGRKSAWSADDLAVGRRDGRQDGEEWAGSHQRLPGGAGVSLIFESTTLPGQGPRLHRHPYPEVFVIRRGSALFTLGDESVIGRAGQVLVAPAGLAHRFVTGSDGYEAVHIHEGPEFETEWLEPPREA